MAAPFSQKGVGAEGFSEAIPFCCTAAAEHRAEGWKRKAGTDPGSPWLPGTARAGVSWGLRPPSPWSRACHLLCLSWYYSLVQIEGAGTWWQDMFQQGLLETGAEGRTGAVSVGNRGFQLLQAAATELCGIGLSVLG